MEKGKIGENLIVQFFDSKLSKFFSFPNPKTRSNKEVADVLVWWNRVVLLIEVKTRTEGSVDTDVWIRSKVKEATEQIIANYKKIKSNETINLFNSFYHTKLDCEGVMETIGLIVLLYDEQSNIIFPAEDFPEIYKQEIPIHVISWQDLSRMTSEVDTIPDFKYYLMDRFEYLKIFDIPLGFELNVLGYYKIHSNKFQKEITDFTKIPYWEIYRDTMSDEINKRESHNQNSGWIDVLESQFHDKRKLFDGYPLGLYFSWEIGSISRRERAYLGEKLSKIQDWFEAGNNIKVFAWFNASTGNWLVFYYSNEEESSLMKSLYRMVELKLIKEVHEEKFDQGIYGFGFQVSVTSPPALLGLVGSVIIGTDEVKGKYSQEDIDESYSYFGKKSDREIIQVKEFPKGS
ncbi:MAG: hypothetical protein IPL16_14620 [Ignavibacteria bacterium]|nr:hypothetical protein [Ignavibacteria bacterium]